MKPVGSFMPDAMEREMLMSTALGKVPADYVILNGKVLNVYTQEVVEDCPVSIKGRWIAGVGIGAEKSIGGDTKIIDVRGKVLTPGLIEGHTHMAWLYAPHELVPFAARGGTTTVITESMELYPVGGLDAVLEFLDSLADQPIRFFSTAPAMVSISPYFNGIDPDDLATLLLRDDIIGLGESYWQEVLKSPDTYLKLYDMTTKHAKFIEGHSAGAKKEKLAAYVAAGASSCHEPIGADDALERLRLGLYVMIREGSIRRDLKAISKIREKGVSTRRMILTTDGVSPVDLIKGGFLEYVVKKAMEYGFTLIEAVSMASINVAEHFGLDGILGGIAPGRLADILILEDERSFSPEMVISSGRIICIESKLLVPPKKCFFSEKSRMSVNTGKRITPDDLVIRSDRKDGTVRVRVIRMVTDLVTAEDTADLPVRNGKVIAKGDLIKVVAMDRVKSPGKSFVGLIRGFGIDRGAMAASAAWDTCDLVAVGASDTEIAFALNRLAEIGGGIVVVLNERVLAELRTEIFGIFSTAPMNEIADALLRVNSAARSIGATFPDPALSLITLTGAAIPWLRICESGLTDLRTGTLMPLIMDNGMMR